MNFREGNQQRDLPLLDQQRTLALARLQSLHVYTQKTHFSPKRREIKTAYRMILKRMIWRRLFCIATVCFCPAISAAGPAAALVPSSRDNKILPTKVAGHHACCENPAIASSVSAALGVRGGNGGTAAVVASQPTNVAARAFAGLHLVNGFLHYFFPGVAARGRYYKYCKPLVDGQDPLVRTLLQSQGEFALALGILSVCLLANKSSLSIETAVGYALLSPIIKTLYFAVSDSVGKVGFNQGALAAQVCLLAAAAHSMFTHQPYGQTLVTVLLSYLLVNGVIGVVNPRFWGQTWGLDRATAERDDSAFLHVLLAFRAMTLSGTVLALFLGVDRHQAIGCGALAEVCMYLFQLLVRKDVQKLGVEAASIYTRLVIGALMCATLLLGGTSETEAVIEARAAMGS